MNRPSGSIRATRKLSRSLASIAAREGEEKAAIGYAERALKLDPRQPTAIAARAHLDNAKGRFAEAEQTIRPLLERPEIAGQARAVALGLLADSLDGQDRPAEAFAAYSSENEELRRLHGRRFSGAPSITNLTQDLVAHFQAAPPERWQVEDNDTGAFEQPRQHVFLLGFYRSGTTLLRQVLSSHPDIVTLEERDFLLNQATSFLSDPSGLSRLAALSGNELQEAREAYWLKVKDHGLTVGGKVFVDKQPMNTIKLPLIVKLFPRAKIVLALRDPRDVVLSCFRRHFDVNVAMFDLLTLEGAATFYDSVMQFAELMRPMFAQPFFMHRYEDMVEDFDGRIGALCDYLGVSFSAAMREFYATVSARDIRSPSATQVTRALYRESLGQWRRYDAQLSPVFPILRPWIEKFDYPVD